MDYWDSARGIALIPYSKLPERLDDLIQGAYLDVDTLPNNLKSIYGNINNKNLDTSVDFQSPNRLAVANSDPNILPNPALLNVQNMFNFPQGGNPALAALFPSPNLPGFPPQFNPSSINLLAGNNISNPFAAPLDSGAVVGGHPPILPPQQHLSNFQNNFPRPQFNSNNNDFNNRGGNQSRGNTRFPSRGFENRGGQGQFNQSRSSRGDRGNGRNWNSGGNYSADRNESNRCGRGGHFQRGSGFRGGGTNRYDHGDKPRFSQALDQPEDGRGFRKFGQQNDDTNDNFNRSATDVPPAKRERKSRFSDANYEVSTSNFPPGMEPHPNTSKTSSITKISPSFEERLNAAFFNGKNVVTPTSMLAPISEQRQEFSTKLPLSNESHILPYQVQSKLKF